MRMIQDSTFLPVCAINMHVENINDRPNCSLHVKKMLFCVIYSHIIL